MKKRVQRIDNPIPREPTRIHKNLIIEALEQHPEDLGIYYPDYSGTVAEFIAELAAHPGIYIVGGFLDVPEEVRS